MPLHVQAEPAAEPLMQMGAESEHENEMRGACAADCTSLHGAFFPVRL